MQKNTKNLFQWAGLGVLVLAAVFAAGMYLRWDYLQKTEKALAAIEGRKITLDDVMGVNLPPKPIQEIVDSTVRGIDVNGNAIRDDVELAIFQKYPNSARLRAALLQYAQVLQLQLTEVFDSETLIRTLQKKNIAFFCLGDKLVSSDSLVLKQKEAELEGLVFNTDLRAAKIEEVYEYMVTYSTPEEKGCDINLSSLPN